MRCFSAAENVQSLKEISALSVLPLNDSLWVGMHVRRRHENACTLKVLQQLLEVVEVLCTSGDGGQKILNIHWTSHMHCPLAWPFV